MRGFFFKGKVQARGGIRDPKELGPEMEYGRVYW